MDEHERLADLVERVLDGDPWHGPNLMALLEGLDAAQAAQQPWPGVHSIWQLVRHMTGWAEEVRARLDGAEAGEPAGGDWPPIDDTSPAAWARALTRLQTAHHSLADAIRRNGRDVLATAVVDHRDGAGGTGQSQYVTAHGLVHHTAYHSGQIALIRRGLEARGAGR